MNIGIVNTFDLYGGAARAAYRLHQGLLNHGESSTMFVQNKQSDDRNIIGPNSKMAKLWSSIVPTLENLPLIRYPNRDKRIFSIGNFSSLDINKHSAKLDVLNFHWVANAFQSINAIAHLNKPLVLTLHDSWAFTGGCHIPFECAKFIDKCGACPQLNSHKQDDLSARILNKKSRLWGEKNIIVVGDGTWVANNAQKSSIFKNNRVEVVHPGLDLNVYKPHDKDFCRSVLGLKKTDKVILFGAISATADTNKGFHLLVPALKKLAGDHKNDPNLKLIVFGASSAGNSDLEIGIDTKYIGKLNDDISLSILYSAADVMIVPSLLEAFGQTASESFACGTPVVAFRTSGLLDIVDHKINGFLADAYDPMDLAAGISWVLSDTERLASLGEQARIKAVNKFGMDKYITDYLNIYRGLLSNK